MDLLIPTPPRKPSFTWLFIFIILFLLASTGVLAYQYYQLKTQVVNLTPTSVPTVSPKPSPAPADPTADWKTYVDPSGYTFSYPGEFKLEQSDNKVVVRIDPPNIETV
ncbi:MAG: hypothetical protein U0946_05970, partial [Patescibacteria group bacterium]|nr:hypothetical protein [Patescibacteria group bacterium]